MYQPLSTVMNLTIFNMPSKDMIPYIMVCSQVLLWLNKDVLSLISTLSLGKAAAALYPHGRELISSRRSAATAGAASVPHAQRV